MTTTEQIVTIALCSLATILTRVLPFLIFSGKKQTPPFISYLGKVLPIALFAMLVVYCLKDVNVLSGNHGIPEAIAIVVTIALHLLFKKSLLSILGGTATYILLVNLIFVA